MSGDLVTIWGQWGPCKESCKVLCDKGVRKRKGICIGKKCHDLKKEKEHCDPDPPPLPPTTAPPTPPTTAPQPPPTTAPPPPPTTAPPPPPTTAPPPPPTTEPQPPTTAPQPPPTTAPPPPPTTAPPPPPTTAPPPPPTTAPPPPPTTAPPTPPTTAPPTPPTTAPPPPPTAPPPPPTTAPPTPPTTPIPNDCDTMYEKAYEHGADGTATFGNLTELISRVATGGNIKVWDRQDNVFYTAQTVLERDGHLCVQVFFDLSVSAFDTFQDDVFWSFDFLCTTGNRMETTYNVGEQVNRGISRDTRSLSWFVRDIVPKRPLYANDKDGNILEGTVQNLVDAIEEGHDFRLTIGNGLRIPAANIEYQGEGDGALVVEMGIFESSRQNVDVDMVRIYEFLSNGMDVWWFTTRSSNAELNLDRWKIGEHERTQSEESSEFAAEWYADSCWRQVYKRSADGWSVSGLVADLISAAEAGKRVRILIGKLNMEADEVRIENGVLCGSFLNRLTKEDFQKLDDDIAWYWTMACTSGIVRTLQYKVGNTEFVDSGSGAEDLTWFVDDREWTKVLETGSDWSEISGSKTELRTAVQSGADIRYRIQVPEEIAGFALANTVIIQQGDTFRFDGSDVSAMHVRSISIAQAPNNEVDFLWMAHTGVSR